jgi:peptide/nickel transport system substrate-binding protein
MPRSLKWMLAFVSIVIVLQIFVACAPMPVPTGVAPTNTPTPIPTATRTPLPTPRVPPIFKSGPVVIGTPQMTAKHFNPLWLTSTPQFLAFPLILPALTWFDDKAQPINDLATKVDVNADATTFTFTLPKEAKWSDGAPLTARDVAFTYKLALDPAINSSLWGINLASIKGATEFQRGAVKDVEGIKVVNDQTIRFELKESNPAFLFNTYLGILPAQVLSKIDPKDIEKQAYVDLPNVTSGAYEIARYEPGKSIQLKKKANYWSKKVNLDEVTIKLFDDTASVAEQLERGTIQIAALSLDDALRFRNVSYLDVLSTKGIAFTVVHIDARTQEQIANIAKPKDIGGRGFFAAKVAKSYLADKRFRQALNYAIDKNAVIKTVVAGEASPIYSAIYGPDWAINSNLNKYDQNVDKAKALMRDAGVKFDEGGNALWDNQPIALTYLASAGDESAKLGAALQQQLSKIGIRLDVKLVVNSAFQEAAIAGDGDLIRNVGARFGVEPSVSGFFYTCKAGWAELVMGYCNPKFDELQGRGLATNKLDDRKKIYADASAILNDEAPSIFLYAANVFVGVNKGLTGVKATADPNYLTFNLQDWTLQK